MKFKNTHNFRGFYHFFKITQEFSLVVNTYKRWVSATCQYDTLFCAGNYTYIYIPSAVLVCWVRSHLDYLQSSQAVLIQLYNNIYQLAGQQWWPNRFSIDPDFQQRSSFFGLDFICLQETVSSNADRTHPACV